MTEAEIPKKPMIIYVGDPMCSWCYGFAPVYREIKETFANQTDSMMLMGGLRPGTTEIMDDKTKKFIAHLCV